MYKMTHICGTGLPANVIAVRKHFKYTVFLRSVATKNPYAFVWKRILRLRLRMTESLNEVTTYRTTDRRGGWSLQGVFRLICMQV